VAATNDPNDPNERNDLDDLDEPDRPDEPDEPLPAYRRLAGILREEILNGRIEPDRPLPSEDTIERRYGIGPEDARRAIDVLSGEGLVYIVEGQGAYVSTRAEETGGG
jgi:GntR family transcriptional regulator